MFWITAHVLIALLTLLPVVPCSHGTDLAVWTQEDTSGVFLKDYSYSSIWSTVGRSPLSRTWLCLARKSRNFRCHKTRRHISMMILLLMLSGDVEINPGPLTGRNQSEQRDFQSGPFMEKYRDRFLRCMHTYSIAGRLHIYNVIPEGLHHQIDHKLITGSEANEKLYLHLRSNAISDTIHHLCDVMTGQNDYPLMKELGEVMKKDVDLPPSRIEERSLPSEKSVSEMESSTVPGPSSVPQGQSDEIQSTGDLPSMEQMERINFYKLASIFVRPVPGALRTLLKVVSRQFSDGKWSIIDFLRLIGIDLTNAPSMSPSKDDRKEWQKFLQKKKQKQKFNVYEDQVPHLLSDDCDDWDVTLLYNVLHKMEKKLSKDVFEGVQSLKELRNDTYGHRSNDTATGDELKEVYDQVIADIKKLGPELSTKTVEDFIKDVQDIRKEELHFGPSHEEIIKEWKKERGRLQALPKQIRDDACCTLDEMEEVIRHGRERMIQHDEELRQGRERVNRHDEELRQGRERMNRHDEELRQGRERVDRHDEDPCQRGINQEEV